MTVYYMTPIATILQYFTDAGIVLNGGKVSTYLAGTSTPQATKTDSTGAVDNANPIILNSAGRLPNVSIWQAQGIKLKIIITDANNNQIGQPIDQVAGIDDPTDLLATLASNSTGSGADLIANSMRSFDLVSSVRAAGAPTLVAGQTRVIDIQAGTTPGDGFGGLFYWDASSSTTDDGVNVIKPTSVSGAGRYLRQQTVAFANFNGSFTGWGGGSSFVMYYKIINNFWVTIYTSSPNLPSTATTFTMTGIPSAALPLSTQTFPCLLKDNSVSNLMGWGFVDNTGTVTFGLGANPNTSGFTAAGSKAAPTYFSYPRT